MSRLIFCALATLFVVPAAAAQAPARALVEGNIGHAEFADSPPVEHSVFGGAVRGYVSRRIAVGPEITFMRGPGADRDWFVLGSATIDLGAVTPGRRMTPYFVAGAGLVSHTAEVGTGLFTSREFAHNAGIGVRIAPQARWYVAPEIRLGSELHWRLGVAAGVAID